MGLYFTGVLLLALCVCSCVRPSAGSAWFQDPPGRSALWMYGIRARPNYDFRNLNCGGTPVQIQPDGSRNCGLCGDPVSDPAPRPNENDGLYANPIIRTRYYESGTVAELSVRNNLASTPGFYEFRLCTDGENPSQECFNRHLLTIEESKTTNVDVPQTSGTNVFHVQLPAGVTCSHCMFQWRFRKENSIAGCDNSNWCGLGRGPQIEFYNCADVIIGNVGQPKPTDPDVLQEPSYDAADYGSAYDIATTLTTSRGSTASNPSSTNAPTTTTTASTTTTRFNVITIPTGTPSATTAASGTLPPNSGRLVLDSNGNQYGNSITVGGSNSRFNNAPLLLLLGLLPILGAASLRDNKPLPAVPLSPTGFWVQNPPMSEYYLGANLGFGNFGNNGMVPFASSTGSSSQFGTLGKSVGTVASYGGNGNGGYYGNRQVFGNPGLGTVPRLANADFATTHVQLREMVQSNSNAINGGAASVNGGSLVSSWGTTGLHNQHTNNHVFPRAAGNQYQSQHTAYQHNAMVAPKPAPSTQYQANIYSNNNNINNNGNFGPGTLSQQISPAQRNMGWNGNNNINNNMNNNINNNGNFGPGTFNQPIPPVQRNMGWNGNNNINNNVNGNTINGIPPGQRVSVPRTVPRQNAPLPPAQQNPAGNQLVDLPGIQSASRFQQSTRTITLSDGPRPASDRRQDAHAHEWFYQLIGHNPLTDTRPQ